MALTQISFGISLKIDGLREYFLFSHQTNLKFHFDFSWFKYQPAELSAAWFLVEVAKDMQLGAEHKTTLAFINNLGSSDGRCSELSVVCEELGSSMEGASLSDPAFEAR